MSPIQALRQSSNDYKLILELTKIHQRSKDIKVCEAIENEITSILSRYNFSIPIPAINSRWKISKSDYIGNEYLEKGSTIRVLEVMIAKDSHIRFEVNGRLMVIKLKQLYKQFKEVMT